MVDIQETKKPVLSSSSSSSSLSLCSPGGTASTSIAEAVYGYHDFKIKGYSLYKGLGNEKYIASNTFMVGGCSWVIRFYPDWMSLEQKTTYVSIYIHCTGQSADARAIFDLTLFDQSGKGSHKVEKYQPHTFTRTNSSWGNKHFIKCADLETSDYLKDDCVHVRCPFGVIQSRDEGRKTYSIPVLPSDMGQHFGRLLESGEGTDVIFDVDGEKFSAHKSVLAARSPVFRAQLFGPMKDNDAHCIKIEDIEVPIFKALLHFIYRDALPEFEELGGLNLGRTSTWMSEHLLVAADRYGLDRMKSICEAKLCENINIDTIATTLALADQHHCSLLKSICLEVVALPENLRAVLKTDGFKYLKESCGAHVLEELLQHIAKEKLETPG